LASIGLGSFLQVLSVLMNWFLSESTASLRQPPQNRGRTWESATLRDPGTKTPMAQQGASSVKKFSKHQPQTPTDADHSGPAGLALDDDGLPERCAQVVVEDARDQIERAARRGWNDDADRTRRIGLCERRGGKRHSAGRGKRKRGNRAARQGQRESHIWSPSVRDDQAAACSAEARADALRLGEKPFFSSVSSIES